MAMHQLLIECTCIRDLSHVILADHQVYRSGMIGPLLGGTLLGIDVSFPVYASAIAFLAGAACAIALPFESAAGVEASFDNGPYTLLH